MQAKQIIEVIRGNHTEIEIQKIPDGMIPTGPTMKNKIRGHNTPFD